MSLASLLIHRMNVGRLVPSVAPSTATVKDYPTFAQGVPCRLQPISSGKRSELLSKSIRASHTVYFAQGSVELDEQQCRVFIAGTTGEFRAFNVVSVEYATEPGRPMVAIIDEVLPKRDRR